MQLQCKCSSFAMQMQRGEPYGTRYQTHKRGRARGWGVGVTSQALLNRTLPNTTPNRLSGSEGGDPGKSTTQQVSQGPWEAV